MMDLDDHRSLPRATDSEIIRQDSVTEDASMLLPAMPSEAAVKQPGCPRFLPTRGPRRGVARYSSGWYIHPAHQELEVRVMGVQLNCTHSFPSEMLQRMMPRQRMSTM